jgi:stalled ribosome rescue protein Dom34
MPVHYHAVLWIDHHEARIIHFNADEAEEKLVHPAHPPRHLHVKAGSASGTHVTDEPQFYRDVADAVADAHEILVAGPSTAKTEFLKYLHKHASQLVARVTGIETLDRLTDGQLVAEARRFFAKEDRMRPQLGGSGY